MGATETTPAGQVAAPNATPEELVLPTRHEVLAAVVRESRCTWEQANELLRFLERVLMWMRDNPNYCDIHHLEVDEMASHHAILEVVMPDDQQIPPEGSAHALIQRRLLRGDEIALVHTKDGDRLEYCAIALILKTTTN